MKKGYIITIDGPSGAGKSTVSRKLAEKMGYLYLDTGAMYRACALKAFKLGLDPSREEDAQKVVSDLKLELVPRGNQIRLFLDGEDITEKIRTEEVGMGASKISQHRVVREKLWELQRKLGEQGGVVAEGRDMGTVVFPDADYKFFLTASLEERARRRYQELLQRGEKVELEQIKKEVEKRDAQDSQRDLAPLKPAPEAILIDTTHLNVDQVVDLILKEIHQGAVC